MCRSDTIEIGSTIFCGGHVFGGRMKAGLKNYHVRNLLLTGSIASSLAIAGCQPGVELGAVSASNNQLSTQSSSTDRGTWDIGTAFPGAGIYQGVTSSLGATDVCSGKDLLGVAGVAICQTGSSSTPASAADVLVGKEFWDVSGNKVTGTLSIVNRGNWNIETTSFPGAGNYTGITSTLGASDLCSGKSIFGNAGTRICQGASAGTNAVAANVLTNTYFWDASGASTQGTMANNGNWNMNTTAWPGAGYYSGLTSTIGPSDVCSSKTVYGASGTAVCRQDAPTVTADASAAEVLAGFEAWDSSGYRITGSMTNRGTFDAAAVFPGNGFYSGTANYPPPAWKIVSGQTVLGVLGTGGAWIGELIKSNVHRKQQSPLLTVASEIGAGSCSNLTDTNRKDCETNGETWTPSALSSGYHEIPNFALDHDGFATGNVTPATHPIPACGTVGSIEARIANCARSWDGSTSGNAGHGLWKLVTSDGAGGEVWRDEQTRLLWSSIVAANVNWCQAAGNTQGNLAVLSYSGTGNGTVTFPLEGAASATRETFDLTAINPTTFSVVGSLSGVRANATVAVPFADSVVAFTINAGATPFVAGDKFVLKSVASGINCQAGAAAGLQPANPISYCYEGSGLYPPPGEDWDALTYSAAKGGMGKNTATKVRWRLPTIYDVKLADLHGLRLVTGASNWSIWTATIYGANAEYADNFTEHIGTVNYTIRSSATLRIRCVGR